MNRKTIILAGGALLVAAFVVYFWVAEKAPVKVHETPPATTETAQPKVEPPEPTPPVEVAPEPALKPVQPSDQVAKSRFIEGGHYELLREAQPVQTGDKIEVAELFWYQCPHCYRLEPFIAKWRQHKPDNAELISIPAVLNPRWVFDAQMYYTLAALGVDRQLHAEVFDTIHRLRRPLKNAAQFADWAAEHGVDREALLATLDSFAVDSKVKFAAVMSRQYGITGVPAVIVDGKYRTSVSLAGSHEELLEVIDYLVALAAEKRAGQ